MVYNGAVRATAESDEDEEKTPFFKTATFWICAGIGVLLIAMITIGVVMHFRVKRNETFNAVLREQNHDDWSPHEQLRRQSPIPILGSSSVLSDPHEMGRRTYFMDMDRFPEGYQKTRRSSMSDMGTRKQHLTDHNVSEYLDIYVKS